MRKKSFFVEIKFLVSLFAVIFASLAGIVIIASNALAGGALGPNNPSDGGNTGGTGSTPAQYTHIFNFKGHTLFLTAYCAPVSDFLLDSVNQGAIIQNSLELYGDSIAVSFNPFTITVNGIGTTQITLSAMVYSVHTQTASRVTRTAAVVVNACLPENLPCDNGSYDNPCDGYNPVIDTARLRFVNIDNVLIFYVLADDNRCNRFILTYTDASHIGVALIANTVRLSPKDQAFSITFTATLNNTIIATVTITQNCL